MARDIGTRIRLARITKDPDLKQKDLANMLGVSPPTMSQIETNNRPPTYAQLEKLSELLDVDLGVFKSATGKDSGSEVHTEKEGLGVSPKKKDSGSASLTEKERFGIFHKGKDSGSEVLTEKEGPEVSPGERDQRHETEPPPPPTPTMDDITSAIMDYPRLEGRDKQTVIAMLEALEEKRMLKNRLDSGEE